MSWDYTKIREYSAVAKNVFLANKAFDENNVEQYLSCAQKAFDLLVDFLMKHEYGCCCLAEWFHIVENFNWTVVEIANEGKENGFDYLEIKTRH